MPGWESWLLVKLMYFGRARYTEAVPLTAPADTLFLAELGLDGRLRPVPGVLPAVAASDDGVRTVVVAANVPIHRAVGPEARDIERASVHRPLRKKRPVMP